HRSDWADHRSAKLRDDGPHRRTHHLRHQSRSAEILMTARSPHLSAACIAGTLLIASLADAAERPLVFRRATVETATKTGKIEKATLVVRDGKIEAVAADAPVPDDAKVIDAAGKTILPGFIDPFWTPSEPALGGGGPRGIVIAGHILNLRRRRASG